MLPAYSYKQGKKIHQKTPENLTKICFKKKNLKLHKSYINFDWFVLNSFKTINPSDLV